MRSDQTFRIALGKGDRGTEKPAVYENRRPAVKAPPFPMEAGPLVTALKKTEGAKELIQQVPSLGKAALWRPVATFRVCGKTGTATFLDIWDADHFDGFTDMQRCVSDCRAWFSDKGFTFWDSGETRTGRINCFFRAPSAGNYVCNAQLQSFGGPAVVECLIDSFNFGPLSFNGSINQPHPCSLTEGFHHFRIRQRSGSFFFHSLTVWRV